MNLRELKRAVSSLAPKELVSLDAWLRELIKATQSGKDDGRAMIKRAALTGRQDDHKTYQLKGVRCGKENCRCTVGELHGPYWYAYWSEGGKTRSQYVGKELPDATKTKQRSRPRRVR
jgi:hypothetical protein